MLEGACPERSRRARDDGSRAEWNRPVWNVSFFSARKLVELDHRNAAIGVASEIDKRPVGLECPGDDFVRGLHIVREPECSSGPRSGLLADFFGEDCCSMSMFGENDTAGETRDAGTDDRRPMLHWNHLRALGRRVI
ncbi:MAG: hypothetical protein Udaeo2_21140 [Candidatus Udaeobacter sp.]|nr:MAG: hypothetical protein Udaeo2_21140 [Candidatus Udaeobacter sp.]